MLISEGYRALNRQLHDHHSEYGSGGGEYAPEVVRLCRKRSYRTVLDYGCGKGSMAQSIRSLEPALTVLEYDPAVPGKTEPPAQPVDMLVCTDVLEHIEPDFIHHVLRHIASLTRQTAFLAINCQPAIKTLPDGRNAHLIVEPKEWWLAQVEQHMRIERFGTAPEDPDRGVVVLAAPKLPASV